MAPFNKRQIGYIQAIAGRQQHRTLICGNKNDFLTSEAGQYEDYHIPQAVEGSLIEGCGIPGGKAMNAKSLLLHTYALDSGSSVAFDSLDHRNNDILEKEDFEDMQESHLGQGKYSFLSAFDAPVKGSHALIGEINENLLDGNSTQVVGNIVETAATSEGELLRNPEHIQSIYRATPDGYLNSTHLTVRFTLPAKFAAGSSHPVSDGPMGQDHYEFRWIVWRHRLPTVHYNGDTLSGYTNLEAIRDGASFRNPGYDFFMGQTGRKRGLLGYTLNKDLDKDKVTGAPDSEAYSGRKWSQGGTNFNLVDVTHQELYPRGEEYGLTVDDLMTMRINRDDYVVMKDTRFFLGKEHGKSHFEDTLHWDWNDPIDTPETNVLSSPTLNGKNYRWNLTLIGTTGGMNPVFLNSSLRWTTKMESG